MMKKIYFLECNIGYLDVPNSAIMKYLDEVNTKIGICKIMPEARFCIKESGKVEFDTLVCSKEMGGDSTGIGALYCKNCILKKQKGNKE